MLIIPIPPVTSAFAGSMSDLYIKRSDMCVTTAFRGHGYRGRAMGVKIILY